MATATVYSKDAVDALVSGSVTGVDINDDGEIILHRQGAADVNAGIARGTGAEYEVQGGDAKGFLEKVTIVDDATDTATWTDRFKLLFKAPLLAARSVFWFNEYGESRMAPAKHNTSALTIYVREDSTVQPNARNNTIPVIVVRDDRVARTHQWGIYDNGEVRFGANAHTWIPAIKLSAAETVPAGLPANTIIFRTAT